MDCCIVAVEASLRACLEHPITWTVSRSCFRRHDNVPGTEI